MSNLSFSKIERVLNAAKNSTFSDRVRNHIENIQLYNGYSEPGYEGNFIAVSDWNNPCNFDKEKDEWVEIDSVMSRLSNLLEKIGVSIEWEDEWSSCNDCGKLVRTQADSYSWRPNFTIVNECELICHDCLDHEDHLLSIEGNYEKCNTIEEINPADYEYVKLDNYENGWYGVNDSPKEIASALKEKGIERFLFNLDSQEQFRQKYSVWVHESEMDLLNESDSEEE